jgi:LmbE family N-acetylglucosaminyl deacetylase
MTFEVLSNTECQDQAMSTFRPNCYIDIKDFLAKKIGAIKCYQSELRSYPHPRSLEGVESLAKKRGMEVCLEYAEAFRIVRDVL